MKYVIGFAGPRDTQLDVIDCSSQTEAELIAQSRSRAQGIDEGVIEDWSWARPATSDALFDLDLLPYEYAE